MTDDEARRRRHEVELELADRPDPAAGDWTDWEGVTVPGWGHALVEVRGGTVRLAVYDEIGDREAIVVLLPEQAAELADWLETAAVDAAQNLTRHD